MATLRLCAVASAFLGGTLTLLYFENYVVIKEKTNRLTRPPVLPPVFRLGSGARVSRPWPPASANLTSSSFVLTKSAKVKEQHVEGRMLRSGSRQAEAPSIGKSERIAIMSPLLCMSILCYMMPGGNPNLSTRGVDMSSRDFNYRIPPGWNPENEHNYSFRAYMTDISIWIMLTDLQVRQQCAAIVMRLGGSAREIGCMITPQEMMNGGIITGVHKKTKMYMHDSTEVCIQPSRNIFLSRRICLRPSSQEDSSLRFLLLP